MLRASDTTGNHGMPVMYIYNILTACDVYIVLRLMFE